MSEESTGYFMPLPIRLNLGEQLYASTRRQVCHSEITQMIKMMDETTREIEDYLGVNLFNKK
ncbi:MAG TPA: hypothetical protein VG892_07630 [Terriglobales bacterium]|nr:hypothetical protein [Terriglobales bacterium]